MVLGEYPPQPALPLILESQSVWANVAVPAPWTTTPGEVCRATWLTGLLFTPSTISISPPAGQLSRLVVQKAGHVPQTLHVRYFLGQGGYACGRWAKSAIMRTSVNVSFDSSRIDFRPDGAISLKSGVM